jgi:hypothetical protein
MNERQEIIKDLLDICDWREQATGYNYDKVREIITGIYGELK